jgi:alpha-D-ribose 1-methylphosphonate 5-triphosphate synthase subunit PhnG
MDRALQTEKAEMPARKRIVDLLARATRLELEAALAGLGDIPDHAVLRGPETGLVMIRGRIGGGGAPFNLGEATMSRASIRLTDGRVGHGYRLGTDRKAAVIAAQIDALAQDASALAALEAGLFSDITERLEDEARQTREETAATKVDFFTMVRGED